MMDPMMDSLSTEFIGPEAYSAIQIGNQSVSDGCNERHFILILDMKQQQKKDKERKERKKN